MKKPALLLGSLLICPSVWAVELVTSFFSVDNYRLYFEMHFTDLPPADEGAAVELYTSEQCFTIPADYERFRFVFDPDGDELLEAPQVTTVGTPGLDRWADGPTDHLSLHQLGFGEWTISGSIGNGANPYQPGTSLCMLVRLPGSDTGWSGLPIQPTAGGSIRLQKVTTTQLATHAGQVIPYSYRIENTSAVFLHDVFLSDDNVDEAPVCEFSGEDQLAPEGLTGSVVFCTARHTVSQDEVNGEAGVSNTASVTADELDLVTTQLTIPLVLHASGFESPPNTVTLLEALHDPVGRDSEIAIGADGKAVIAYTDSEGDLKVAKCLDLACSAALLSVVQSGNAGDPSIAIGNDLLPVISYFDLAAGALLVAKCNDDACRGGDETLGTVDQGNVGTDSSLAIGIDGLPVISYGDRANGTLKVAHCNDAGCLGSDETISTLDAADEAVGLHTSIAIGADGFPVISFLGFNGPFAGTVRVAKCNDVACSGGDETVSIVDSIGGPGFASSSIALGADDNPVIAYVDTVTDAVKVVKCNDAACQGGDEAVSVVASASSYMTVSLAISADGYPAVSYMGSLTFAHCNDDACSGGDESIAVVDSTANARSSSLAIGSDDLPIISYFDELTGGLRLAHCGTANCR